MNDRTSDEASQTEQKCGGHMSALHRDACPLCNPPARQSSKDVSSHAPLLDRLEGRAFLQGVHYATQADAWMREAADEIRHLRGETSKPRPLASYRELNYEQLCALAASLEKENGELKRSAVKASEVP